MQIKNSDIFVLPGHKNILHLATIAKGFQEFIVILSFSRSAEPTIYIEEVVLTTSSIREDISANLKYIADDNLAFDLAKFAEEKGITNMELIRDKILKARLG